MIDKLIEEGRSFFMTACCLKDRGNAEGWFVFGKAIEIDHILRDILGAECMLTEGYIYAYNKARETFNW